MIYVTIQTPRVRDFVIVTGDKNYTYRYSHHQTFIVSFQKVQTISGRMLY